MIKEPLLEQLEAARSEKRRLVVPLLGFPGLTMTGTTIKVAQQNYGEHFRVIKALSREFQADVAFPLMDLAVEANALGLYTVFPQNESATVLRDAFSIESLAGLNRINVSFDTRLLGYVETLKLMNLGLPGSVLRGAYVIGPYTLAALLMGADEAAMATVMQPGNLRKVCEFTTEVIQKYVRQLIAAGAQIICILEPSAVMLSPGQFWEFSAGFIRHINDSVQYSHASTIYHTCGNTMHLLDKMVESGVDGVSLDSPAAGVDLPAAARSLAPEVVVMGNINPTGAILHGTPADVEAEVSQLLTAMDFHPNFVLSTGCDLPQETPLDNIAAFMQAGRRHRVA